MKISQLIATIKSQYQQPPDRRRPIFAQGVPGVGKSDAFRQAAHELGIGFMDLQATIEDPITLSGLPARAIGPSDSDRERFPALQHFDHAVFLPFADKLPTAGAGILCIDEINTAPPAVQAGLYDLFLHGKLGSYCYDDQTRVMTAGGLRHFKDLTLNDRLMTLNPQSGQIEYHAPERIIQRPYCGELIHFKGRSVSFRVTPDHRMWVRRRDQAAFEFIEADSLSRMNVKRIETARTGKWRGVNRDGFEIPLPSTYVGRVEHKSRIRTLRAGGMSPLQIQSLGYGRGAVESALYTKKDPARSFRLLTSFGAEDWVRFIGWFLAEGCVVQGGPRYRIMVAQDRTANPAKHAEISAIMRRLGFTVQEKPDALVTTNKGLGEYLLQFGHAADKFIPPQLKALRPGLLRPLLKALLDGDGSDGRRYITISPRLRDDVAEIALKCGYSVTFREDETEQGRPIWILSLGRGHTTPRIAEAVREQYDGVTYCVTVPNGLIMVERDGRFGWCGNCLPPGWAVGATGNRDEDRAATQRIPMPLMGRWTRVLVEVSIDDWTKWALVHDIRTEMIAFFQWKPELFHTFDPGKQEPYCCPRTAVFASHIIDSAPHGLEHELLCGTVGEGVATELVAFMRTYRQMVSPDAILLDPSGAPVPDEPAAACAISAALAHKATDGNFHRVLTYAARMMKEYEILIIKLATHRDMTLCMTRAFIQWASENAEIVL